MVKVIRRYAALVVLILSFSLLMVGCSNKESPEPTAGTGETAPVTGGTSSQSQTGKLPARLTYLTLETGSTFNTMAVAQASLLSQKLGIQVAPEPTAGSQIQADLLRAGEGDLAIENAVDAYEMYKGTGPFSDKGPVPVLLALQGEEGFYSFVNYPGTGIKSLADLKGHKVLSRRAGIEWAGVISDELFKAVGLDPEKDVEQLLYESSAKAFQDVVMGKASAVWGGLLPEKLEDLGRSKGIYIIPIEQPVAVQVQKAVPAFHPTVLPRDFPGGPKGTPVLGDYTAVIARKDLGEDVVYQVVKTLIENREELVRARAVFAEWTAERAVSNPTLPFHPGAVKYFKEAGVWTDQLEQFQSQIK